jgi:tetratricopeptide (TPR) repeat protein
LLGLSNDCAHLLHSPRFAVLLVLKYQSIMQQTIMAGLAACLLALGTQAQVKMPAPSSSQTIKQDFGIGSIELTYSRPSLKGRKLYTDLAPAGKLWRTGANAATRLRFTEPVEMGGKKIDTGSYVLYTVPNEDNWEIVLNKGLTNWGTDGYKESEDICRFRVTPERARTAAETFTMQFANIQPESCELQLLWGKVIVPIAITTNIKDKVRAQLEAALQTDKKPYWQATQFYNEYDNNKAKALEYATKATEANPKAFWVWLYKARLQKDLGDIAGAKASANKSLELAKEAKNDDYVRMNEELLRKLR